jgi:hypothetical protein
MEGTGPPEQCCGHQVGDTGHILAIPVYFWNLVSHRIVKVQSPQASSTLRDCKCEAPLLGSRHGPVKLFLLCPTVRVVATGAGKECDCAPLSGTSTSIPLDVCPSVSLRRSNERSKQLRCIALSNRVQLGRRFGVPGGLP